MPIFDFICKDCGHEYEDFIMRDHRSVCPACGSSRTIKELSAPNLGGFYKKAWDRQPPSNPTKVYVDRRAKKKN
ncbi:MAG: zinc ribbon domain-containing protein [Desulfurellales bacterium]|nr:MAG: zinc ribbon domain-containing protein [Desulfurellales bacterium]